MTLLKIDGFDHYDTSYLEKKGWAIVNTPVINSSAGRRGGGSCHLTNLDEIQYIINDSGGIQYVFGFAFYCGTLPNASALRLIGRGQNDGAGTWFNLYLNYKGKLALWTQAPPSLTLNSAEWIVSAATWHYLELKFKFSNEDGYYELRLDNNFIFSWGPGDNKWSGGYDVDLIKLVGPNAVQGMHVDDFYLLDDTGSKNKNFLGPCRIDTVLPDGAGNYAQMTPVNQTNNYECVDEAQLDEGDFVYGENNGEKDSYTFPNLDSEIKDNIPGIQANFSGERTTPAVIQARDIIRKSSTDYFGSAKDLDEGVTKIKSTIHETDPSDSSDWDKSKIDACEFGMDIVK